jgi:hypothetical protein
MPKPRTQPRFRCRFCGIVFSAWIRVPGEPDGALLLYHMSQSHPAELAPFLDQVHTTDDITPAIAQAFEVIKQAWSTGQDRSTCDNRAQQGAMAMSMTIGELQTLLGGMDPTMPVVVALFRRDGTTAIFPVEALRDQQGTAQLECSEAEQP